MVCRCRKQQCLPFSKNKRYYFISTYCRGINVSNLSCKGANKSDSCLGCKILIHFRWSFGLFWLFLQCIVCSKSNTKGNSHCKRFFKNLISVNHFLVTDLFVVKIDYFENWTEKLGYFCGNENVLWQHSPSSVKTHKGKKKKVLSTRSNSYWIFGAFIAFCVSNGLEM